MNKYIFNCILNHATKHFPGFIAFIDITEQQITRPKNKRRRKMDHSGKRKKHTVKNQYMVNNDDPIIYKTKHKQVGKRHDYNIYKRNRPVTPEKVENIFDSRILGSGKRLSRTKVITTV